jgi:MGT family glycosyltransferase
MARFLICTKPITGHVNPALVIASALVGRGHSVVCYTGAKFKAKVEAVGARFAPMQAAYDYNDDDYKAAFPERARYQGLKQIKFDFKHVFIEPGPDQARDLRALLAGESFDVVLSDPGFLGARMLYDTGEIKAWAVFNISVLGLPSQDVPPFGLGMLPDYGPLGRIKNRLITILANKVVFRDVNAFLKTTLAKMDLPPEQFAPMFSPMLYLQPSVPAFEYPRSDLPASVHFIGPLLPTFKGEFNPPEWWPEILAASQPVILVTQGTIATDVGEVIVPALQALAAEEALVVATTGGKDLGIALPANARTTPFIPFNHLMPHVSLMLTNGGYGGVTIAMAHGVPAICAGTTEDKPEVGNRVAYAGAGINLKTNRPSPDAIRQAVRMILADQRYRQAAQRLQAACAQFDAPAEAARLLETLAATRQPVLRGAEPPWRARSV